MPLYRVAWDALNFHRHSEFHQSSASAGSMKTVYVSWSIVVIWRRASKVVRPNPSLKRNTKSGPSYSASLLNFRPARFWYPLSSNVRPQNRHLCSRLLLPRKNSWIQGTGLSLQQQYWGQYWAYKRKRHWKQLGNERVERLDCSRN